MTFTPKKEDVWVTCPVKTCGRPKHKSRPCVCEQEMKLESNEDSEEMKGGLKNE